MILKSACLPGGMARACSLSHILFPRASALYKIRNIKSPNPKMISTDWVIYFKLRFTSKFVFLIFKITTTF
ncbi:hypothetical protein BU075_09225 [Mammaliicoccus vitulinus]|nr:hypothetical protein BU075_09225 [Mammaliicoccus vitulinus]